MLESASKQSDEKLATGNSKLDPFTENPFFVLNKQIIIGS
jgi:hypothetical protein